jgi:hypothetical protein
MTTGNDVGLVKQFNAYFARNECPKTVKVVLERFQLLLGFVGFWRFFQLLWHLGFEAVLA